MVWSPGKAQVCISLTPAINSYLPLKSEFKQLKVHKIPIWWHDCLACPQSQWASPKSHSKIKILIHCRSEKWRGINSEEEELTLMSWEVLEQWGWGNTGGSQVFGLWAPQHWGHKGIINKSSELGIQFFLLLQFFQRKSSSFSLAWGSWRMKAAGSLMSLDSSSYQLEVPLQAPRRVSTALLPAFSPSCALQAHQEFQI